MKNKFLRKASLLKLIDRLPGTILEYREWPNGKSVFPYSTKAITEVFFESPKALSKDGSLAWDKICEDSQIELRKARIILTREG